MQSSDQLQGFLKPVVISPELTRAMGLEDFYTVDGNAVYSPALLSLWWSNYIRENNLSNGGLITPDLKMIQLFYESRPYRFVDLQKHLAGHINKLVNVNQDSQLLNDLTEEQESLLAERDQWLIDHADELKAKRLARRNIYRQ